MIVVRNIRYADEYSNTKLTKLLPAWDTLHDAEQIEAQRLFGRDTVLGYEGWKSKKGSHNSLPIHDQNIVLISPVNDNDTYAGDIMAEVIGDICCGAEGVEFVTRGDMLMIGLPGGDQRQRERALEDLKRWFGAEGVENKITVLCREAD